MKDFSRLKRAREPMPQDVLDKLIETSLFDAYHRRPAYQQNDYLRWFSFAKRAATRQKRIDQMIEDLRGGKLYMGMAYHGE